MFCILKNEAGRYLTRTRLVKLDTYVAPELCIVRRVHDVQNSRPFLVWTNLSSVGLYCTSDSFLHLSQLLVLSEMS